MPFFFRLWHALVVFCISTVSYRSPQKARTITNHRSTRPLSRLWHRIEAASRPAGTVRTLVPSPADFRPCVSPGISSTLTVDLTVLIGEKPELRMDAIDDAALAFNECSSCICFCLPFRREDDLEKSSAGISIAQAMPRLCPLWVDMSDWAHTMPPALTMLVVTPELWSGSTLRAVRNAGKSMESRPMFARISWCTVGETGLRLMLEVDRLIRKRSWRWKPCVDDDGSERSGTVTVTCLSVLLRAWREVHGPGVPFELVIAFVTVLVICVKVGGCIRILCPQC